MIVQPSSKELYCCWLLSC